MHESNFGKGAVIDPIDERDISYAKVAMGTVPFDWNKGFDIEEELGRALNINDFKITPKDQNGSSSCGGQAWSYYGAVLEALATGTYEERSAKFIYAQTYVGNGGSAGRTNCELVINQGWAREAVCSSYNGGNPPDEAFMERKSDITDEARADAKKAKALAYSNVTPDIELFAIAIRDQKGVIGGIYGMNNGTWLSPFPKPPVVRAQYWSHWIYFGKAKLINGKPMVAFINSWGPVGDAGWQWVDTSYFGPIPGGGDNLIWSGWTLLYKGSDPEFKHTFTATLRKGSRGDEVKALQTALTLEGMFKGKIDGVFGPITFASVEVFQARYALGVDGIVGPKTNGKLNQLFA